MNENQKHVLEEFNRSVMRIIDVPMDSQIKAAFAFQAGFVISTIFGLETEIKRLKGIIELRDAKRSMEENEL